MKITKFFGVWIMVLVMVQCTTSSDNEDSHVDEDSHGGHGAHEEEGEVVTLSSIQIANAGIKTSDSFDTMNVSGFVKANGSFDLPPDNVAAITAPMRGTVKRANYLVGSYVKRGAVLATLEHPDYIKMQEEYLNTTNNLDYLKAAYQRQQTLDSANITALKAVQEAKAAYLSAMTKKLSLEKQLQYIGINPEHVVAGKISSTIAIRAPFSGYITVLNVHKGEFVNPEQELYELINKEHMHLELNVFEKDIFNIKEGQQIEFTVPSLGSELYSGEVFLVGQSFDRKSKTIKVHGHIDDMKPQFIRGLYLEASIFTDNQQVKALPETAIVRNDGKTFIFVRQQDPHGHEEGHQHDSSHQDVPEAEHAHEEDHAHGHNDTPGSTRFRPVEVVTGISRNHMVEIRSVERFNPQEAIVIQGAYDLFSEMKKGEGGHHH